MRNVPAEVRATMAVRRNFVNYATVTLSDGTVLYLQPQDFRLNGNEFTDELVDGQDFQVGSVIGKSALVRLDNSNERFSQYDFYKAYFYLYVHLPDAQTVGTSVQDGIFNIGKFTVLEPETSGTVIEFAGVDDMYKFDLPFDNCSLDFNTVPSMYTILARCCTDCGVAIGFDNTFDNADLRTNIKPEGVTYREVVSYVCQIAGVNAKINTSGALVLQWYDMSPLNSVNLDGGTFNFNDGDNADGGSFSPWSVGTVFDGGSFAESTGYHNLYNLKQLRVATDDIQFTGVRVIYEETVQLVGTESYVLEVKDNPFTSGRESTIATFLYNKLSGLKFRPFSCSYLQDPFIESGDPVMVYDIKGNAYKSIITNVTYSTGGYMSLMCNAKDPVKQASTYRNPAAQAVVEARRNTAKQIDSYASTVDHFNEIASNALGYYKTEIIESGATITYLHDQPTLASSTYVIKITGQGIYISEDGGETYTSGYDTTTATLLLNLVYVHGITADWVTSGIFQDKQGKFVLDVDNGTLKLDLSSQVGTGTGSTTLGGMLTNINANAEGLSSEVLRAQAAENALNSSYSGRYVPTTDNSPASSWNTQALKEQHANDLFINTDNGNVYAWKNSTGGVWLTFDGRSQTESAGLDYVRVYYWDSSINAYRYTKTYGGKGSNNTIAGLKLFVPANSFYVYWRSDTSVTDWGFEITACESGVASDYLDLYPNTASSLPSATSQVTLSGISTKPATAHNYGNSETKLWTWNTNLTLPSSGWNWTLQTDLQGTKSVITQTAQEISLKVSKGDVSSQLSLETGRITLSTTGRLVISSGNFQLDANGTMTCVNANIKGTINVGYSNDSYGVINVYGTGSPTSPEMKLDNSGLVAYSHNYDETYFYETKYARSGMLNETARKISAINYYANLIGYYVSGTTEPYAYIGIQGKDTLYQALMIYNRRNNIYIYARKDGESDAGVVRFASNLDNEPSGNYTRFKEVTMELNANSSEGNTNNKPRVSFNFQQERYRESTGTHDQSYAGSSYIDRLGYHGGLYGNAHLTGVWVTDSDDIDQEGVDVPNFRVRVYAGGDYSAGYYQLTFTKGILTNVYYEGS